jgi:hypothetical protein
MKSKGLAFASAFFFPGLTGAIGKTGVLVPVEVVDALADKNDIAFMRSCVSVKPAKKIKQGSFFFSQTT